jgi:hypothetical protein
MSPIERIEPQNHRNFYPFDEKTNIKIRRVDWRGAAPFVVYAEGGEVLRAGECPALSARPPYCEAAIPADTAFRVQNLSVAVAIEVIY